MPGRALPISPSGPVPLGAALMERDQSDWQAILSQRARNGADFWATPDGRWGVGAPFSTLDCGLMLSELGLKNSDPIAAGIAEVLLRSWEKDGRIRPGPGLPVQSCHTAGAARLLCRLGFVQDERLAQTFEWLLQHQHDDGGWRCHRIRLGASPETDASNPGVTLAVLDAFRFVAASTETERLDAAVDTLLDHWTTRRPLGPCAYGIGSRFLQVEYPFIRYNLFFYVYVLSFYKRAHRSPAFHEAFRMLEAKRVDGAVTVEHARPGLGAINFCRAGAPSPLATSRYQEIVRKLADRAEIIGPPAAD